ncbi:MAG TPA: hypothetical protein VMH32_22315 [Burkholderiales bacterium]|nr:hypothetical protein [Burkholderiales bacterium]
MNVFTSFSIAGAALALCACSLLGEPKPSGETAVVKPGFWGAAYRGGYVEIVSIDGVQPSWRLRSALEISAGDRAALFYVYLCNEGPRLCMSGVSIAQAQVSFRAQGGHAYRPRAREQVNGSNRFWVWVEDAASGEVAGGTVPPAAGS